MQRKKCGERFFIDSRFFLRQPWCLSFFFSQPFLCMMQAVFYRKSRYVSPVRKHRSQPRLQLPRLHRLQPRFSANTATAVHNNYSPQLLNLTYLGASTTAAATERKLSPGEGSCAVNPSGGHHGVRPPIGPAAATAAVTLLLHADHGSSLKTGIHASLLAWLLCGQPPRRPVL